MNKGLKGLKDGALDELYSDIVKESRKELRKVERALLFVRANMIKAPNRRETAIWAYLGEVLQTKSEFLQMNIEVNGNLLAKSKSKGGH